MGTLHTFYALRNCYVFENSWASRISMLSELLLLSSEDVKIWHMADYIFKNIQSNNIHKSKATQCNVFVTKEGHGLLINLYHT